MYTDIRLISGVRIPSAQRCAACLRLRQKAPEEASPPAQRRLGEHLVSHCVFSPLVVATFAPNRDTCWAWRRHWKPESLDQDLHPHPPRWHLSQAPSLILPRTFTCDCRRTCAARSMQGLWPAAGEAVPRHLRTRLCAP